MNETKVRDILLDTRTNTTIVSKSLVSEEKLMGEDLYLYPMRPWRHSQVLHGKGIGWIGGEVIPHCGSSLSVGTAREGYASSSNVAAGRSSSNNEGTEMFAAEVVGKLEEEV